MTTTNIKEAYAKYKEDLDYKKQLKTETAVQRLELIDHPALAPLRKAIEKQIVDELCEFIDPDVSHDGIFTLYINDLPVRLPVDLYKELRDLSIYASSTDVNKTVKSWVAAIFIQLCIDNGIKDELTLKLSQDTYSSLYCYPAPWYYEALLPLCKLLHINIPTTIKLNEEYIGLIIEGDKLDQLREMIIPKVKGTDNDD